jgi:hypothetical protein
VTPDEWPRWTRLWQQYTQEYVAATHHTTLNQWRDTAVAEPATYPVLPKLEPWR